MLPDYPESKEKLHKLLMRAFTKTPNQGLLSQIPKRRFFEGNKTGIAREDGSVDVSRFMTFKSEMKLNVKALEGARTEDVARMVQQRADQMHFQQTKAMFEKVEQVVSSVGNSVNLGGNPLTPEAFIQLFERIRTEFDDEGKPYMPSIVCGKEGFEIFKKVLDQIEADPALRKSVDEMISKKRSDWHDRESRRKLVG
jgi:hypothetical protein